MATGYKGQGFRKKRFDITAPVGDSILYTVPDDVVFAKVFISKLEFENVDGSESTSMNAERLVLGTWRVCHSISITHGTLGSANQDAALYPVYESGATTFDASNFDHAGILQGQGFVGQYNILGNPAFAVNSDVPLMMSGDRIRVNVSTSGETARYVGFIIEETAETTVITL